jgi:hypothetical protein
MLRFVIADGRSIQQRGYRLEDFVDDADENPSREGFCTTAVQPIIPGWTTNTSASESCSEWSSAPLPTTSDSGLR